MAFEMRLWKVTGSALESLPQSQLNQEERLEDWIAADTSILGMNIVIIGRQVQTEFAGRIDLLALDSDANCVILELKKGRTPREVVAQTLEYAAWIKQAGYKQLDQITQTYLKKNLATAYEESFGESIPEQVNSDHSMVIMAAELDDSSERIIAYLSEEHEININALFFNFFSNNGTEFLGRAWLRDPEEISQRVNSQKRAPWSGYWFVNVGEGPNRNWDDNIKYGYLGAGQGEKYSRPLTTLKPGDKVFAYLKGQGYVGYGQVTTEATPIKNFIVTSAGKSLAEMPLRAPRATANVDSPDLAEWAVGVKWLKTYDRNEAKTFRGAFANQHIVCKLRDPNTVEFVRKEFAAE